MDYLGEGDFDTVYALCMERDTIGLTCSSTPTGKRSKFFEICTNKSLGLKQIIRFFITVSSKKLKIAPLLSNQ